MRSGIQAVSRFVCRLAPILNKAAMAGVLTVAAVTAVEARQASIVVDANSGAVISQSNADAARFPASLTKVMTLYMLFEQVEAGRLTLNSRLPVSADAARQPPTRLGLRPGDTVRVEDAIQALVTRSANDVAVVVAEAVAGSEEAFAERMTRRARQIGMSRTTFRNASGLPNAEQVTTARDMALLGRAIYERFPEYSRYFGRRAFTYRGRAIRNHNRLLGRVHAVDGIKTGYTRASGFNLLTSARGNGRHLVAVVMGGQTSRTRDAQMSRLVQRHFTQMATRRTDFSVAQRVRGRTPEAITVARAPEPRPQINDEAPAARAVVAERAAPERPVQERAAERPRPAVVPVPAPTPAPAPAVAAQAAPAAPVQTAAVAETLRREILQPTAPVRAASAGGPVLQWQTGPQPVAAVAAAAQAGAAQPSGALITNTAPARPAQAAAAAIAPSSGWVVQIAATNSESEAQRMLREAKDSVGRRLAGTTPVTERIQHRGATLFRARFAGFSDRSQAEAACAALKASEYACMAIRL